MDENKEVNEEKEPKVTRVVVRKKNNTNNKVALIILCIIVILIATIALVITNMDEVKTISNLSKLTLKETDIYFQLEGYASLENDTLTNYKLDLDDTKKDIQVIEKGKDETVYFNETLISYKEKIYGEEKSEEIRTTHEGYIIKLNSSEIKVRSDIKYTVVVNGYMPGIGDYAFIKLNIKDEEKNVLKGRVTGVISVLGRGNAVTIEFENTSVKLPTASTTKTYFQTTERSSMYSLEDTTLEEDKILVKGEGKGDAVYISTSIGEFEETIQVYSNKIPDTTSSDVEKIDSELKVGQFVQTNSLLYTLKIKPYGYTDKVIKSELEGKINYKKVNFDRDKNITHATFDIYDDSFNTLKIKVERNIDKIELGKQIELNTEELTVLGKISEINEDHIVVTSDSFNKFYIGDKFDYYIKSNQEKALLIPKEYVKYGKVKKLIGEDYIELVITYKEYNNEMYRVLSGLKVGDSIEIYEQENDIYEIENDIYE